MKLSPVRWSFGSRLTVAIRKLSSAVMLKRYSVLKTALSVWREKRCLSVWFISEFERLCLRVQLLFFCNYDLLYDGVLICNSAFSSSKIVLSKHSLNAGSELLNLSQAV